MSKERFAELLKLYLDETIASEERAELMEFIRQGGYEAELRKSIEATMINEIPVSDLDSGIADEIVRNILDSQPQDKKIIPMRAWYWTAAASVMIATVASLWFFTKTDATTPAQIVYENVQPRIFQDKQYVKLPDGSTAILSKGSELRHSEKFGQGTREVTLIGEAYFDVAHDPTRPFKVITDKITTTVLGTAFNVNAWPGQEKVTVTVTRGKVQVADEFKILGVITPDQQISVSTATDEFTRTTNAEEASVIRNKYLVFDRVSMETAAAIIEERYNTKVVFDNEAIKNCKVTARFLDGEDLNQVMFVVSGVIEASYEMQPDGSIILKGKGCK